MNERVKRDKSRHRFAHSFLRLLFALPPLRPIFAMWPLSELTIFPPLRPFARASSGVNLCARPSACAALPPWLARFFRSSGERAANPRLLIGRTLLFQLLMELIYVFARSDPGLARLFDLRICEHKSLATKVRGNDFLRQFSQLLSKIQRASQETSAVCGSLVGFAQDFGF